MICTHLIQILSFCKKIRQKSTRINRSSWKQETLEISVEGKVDSVVEPGKVWRVEHDGTLWFARSNTLDNLNSGDWIRVVGRKGIILFVEPLETSD